ncbi:hypothetical protein [Botrimarina mediterranea]|uniref:DUF91 domain-containing protein n=1 Tax=Botrimarina mediterranea TaxID=2528022 RepID=A0A518KD39_9BACT|nr:hypothetical protein [Botrimarina mediterranea]QDV75705.1 hypothetical protein Spa11_39260 [Botrimarina mediterranea]
MLRIDRAQQSLSTLATPSFAGASITERYDLQEFIANSPEAFFGEVGERLFVIGKEIVPSKNVMDRVDLLCVDQEGATVIVELKRGNHKLHLLQAISYAGMLAEWSADDVLERLNEDQQEALAEFLDVEVSLLNRSQRIMLIAEGYDYALLVATEWLNEQFGVPITCCRVGMATDAASNAEYLVCSTVYPAPELAQQAAPRGRQAIERRSGGKWASWEDALASTENPIAEAFYRKQLDDGRENRLRYRLLRFRVHGKRRFVTELRRIGATAVQFGRFPGDLNFWRERISDPQSLATRVQDSEVRFHLRTETDFATFLDCLDGDLQRVDWLRETIELREDDEQ